MKPRIVRILTPGGVGVRTHPFITGGSCGGTPCFAGRSEVVAELELVLRRPGRAVFVIDAARAMGKSSLLAELRARLPSRGPFVPVPVVPSGATPTSVAVAALGAAIAAAAGVEAPDPGVWPEEAVLRRFLPSVLAGLPAGGRLVFLVDEAEAPLDPSRRDGPGGLLAWLASAVELAPDRVAVVIASGRFAEPAQALVRCFGPTVRRRLGPLSERDVRLLTAHAAREGPHRFAPAGAEMLWRLTRGHPALVQVLAAAAWDAAAAPAAELGEREVLEAWVPALERGGPVFAWMWEGLSTAAQVVASALTVQDELSPTSSGTLAEVLHRAGVRAVLPALEDAPRALRNAEVLVADPEVLEFQSALFRRWVQAEHPPAQTLLLLDRLDPVAQAAVEAAAAAWLRGGAAAAEGVVEALRGALDRNPNHAEAAGLLAEVHHARGQSAEAQRVLERLFSAQPAAARARLLRVLLDRAEAAADDEARVPLLRRALEVAPGHREASEELARAWARLGDAAIRANDLDRARELYRLAGRSDSVEHVRAHVAEKESARLLEEIRLLEAQDRKTEALAFAREARERHPTPDLTATVQRLDQDLRVSAAYQQALGALATGDRSTAVQRLAEVIAARPHHPEAARRYYEAVHGVDPQELIARQRRMVPWWSLAVLMALCVVLAASLVVDPHAPTGDAPRRLTRTQAALETAPAPGAGPAAPTPLAPSPTEAAPVAPTPPAPAAAAPPPAAPARPAPAPAGGASLVRRGWSLVDAGDLPGAARAFDDALAADPASAEGWYGAGYVAEAQGSVPLAVRAYCRALSRAEDSTRREVQGRLRALGQGCEG